MRKFKYYILAFIFLLPLRVSADSCDFKELSRQKKLAANVSYSIVPEIIETGEKDIEDMSDYAEFTITFTNLVDGLYIYDEYMFNDYRPKDGIVRIKYEQGDKLLFSIKNDKCLDAKLLTFYVKLPNYNGYSTTSICANYQNAPVCQKWITKSLNSKDIKAYIEKNTVKEENKINKKDVKGIFDYFFDYYIKYYYFAIPITIVIFALIILIYRMYKRKKESLF